MKQEISGAEVRDLANGKSEKGDAIREKGPQPSKKRGRAASTSNLSSLRKRRTKNDTGCDGKYAQIDAANQLSIEDFRSTYFPSNSPLRQHISEKNDVIFHFILHSVKSIPETTLNACFSLIEETSREAYKASQRGWKPRAKYREMREPDMKYVLVYKSKNIGSSNEYVDLESFPPDKAFVGFLSFQLTTEPPDQVLYIYEIHLASDVRGIGLGYRLMHLAQRIASNVGVAKMMLTVFTSNAKARKFYEKLGYFVDDISPQDRELRGTIRPADYAILSKAV